MNLINQTKGNISNKITEIDLKLNSDVTMKMLMMNTHILK